MNDPLIGWLIAGSIIGFGLTMPLLATAGGKNLFTDLQRSPPPFGATHIQAPTPDRNPTANASKQVLAVGAYMPHQTAPQRCR